VWEIVSCLSENMGCVCSAASMNIYVFLSILLFIYLFKEGNRTFVPCVFVSCSW
jgi:hypothetical protein